MSQPDDPVPSDPATVLHIAQREVDEADARIKGLLHEHRILRHLRFREENIRILKKGAAERTDPQQDRIDHLVAAQQSRSAALEFGSGVTCSSALPKSVRAAAFAGVDGEHKGSSRSRVKLTKSTTTDDEAAAEAKTSSSRRPIKSQLSHVLNDADKIHSKRLCAANNKGVMRVPRQPDHELGDFAMTFDVSPSQKKAAELERERNHQPLQRTVPEVLSGHSARFESRKHHSGMAVPRPPSGSPRVGGDSLNSEKLQSSVRFFVERAASKKEQAAALAQLRGVDRHAYVARELNKNTKLMRPGDQFKRSQTYTAVTHTLQRLEMLKQLKQKQQAVLRGAGRTKFSLAGDGLEAMTDDTYAHAEVAPRGAQVVVDTSKAVPMRYVREGAYLIADRRRGAWDEADRYFLENCPARPLPKTWGVTQKGFNLLSPPPQSGRRGGAAQMSSARSDVSELTASSATGKSGRRG